MSEGAATEPAPAGPTRPWQRLLPTPWQLLVLCLLWLWRLAALQGLAGGLDPLLAASGGGVDGAAIATGLLVDVLLVDGCFALLRWIVLDRRERARGQGPQRWLLPLATAALALVVGARALDGLHCHITHRHLDAAFLDWLADQGGSWFWDLRYLLAAVALTTWAGSFAMGRELRELRGRSARLAALRALVGICVGAWILSAASAAWAPWIVAGEWQLVTAFLSRLLGT